MIGEEVLTQGFDREVVIDELKFDMVKLFHPRQGLSLRFLALLVMFLDRHPDHWIFRWIIFIAECMGTIYLADPVCEDANATLPLEVHVITFDSPYYSTNQGTSPSSPTQTLDSPSIISHFCPAGRKKLKQAENEIIKLTKIRHVNLLSVYAVKLAFPIAGSPRMAILLEQRPSMSLYDVLVDCDALREERATVIIICFLSAVYPQLRIHSGRTTFAKYFPDFKPSIRENWSIVH